MKQQRFEAQFAPQWQRFERLLQQLEGRAESGAERISSATFASDYRRLCHHLSLARERHYSSQLIERLNEMVLRGHQQLYRRKTHLLSSFLAFIVVGFPQLVRREWRLCLLASGLLYLPALLLFFFVWRYPELIYAILDPAMVESFERMYDPAADHLGQERGASSDFYMFGYYIQNNISIGFRTFAGGILFGLGSIFFLVFNGSLFGALAAHVTNIGYQASFFPFVIGHGAFELTAIALSGAAGLKLGFALLAPGRRGRLAALREAAREAVPMVFGVILMLLIAAFVEAFWSASSVVEPWGKYLVGSIMWCFVALYFLLMGRRRHGA